MEQNLQFTDWEIKILRGLSEGKLPKQLTDIPGHYCEVSKVTKRVSAIRKKLGVVTNAEAIEKAQALGLLNSVAVQ